MTIEKIINQLYSLKENSQSFITKDSEPVWQEDVDALDRTIAILSALSESGVQSLGDLKAAIVAHKEMKLKHCNAARPIPKDGVLHCPDCNKRVHAGHSFCHRCGKRLR